MHHTFMAKMITYSHTCDLAGYDYGLGFKIRVMGGFRAAGVRFGFSPSHTAISFQTRKPKHTARNKSSIGASDGLYIKIFRLIPRQG